MAGHLRGAGAASLIVVVLLLPGCAGGGDGSGAGPRPSLSVSPTRTLSGPTRSPDRTSRPTETPTSETSATKTAEPSPTEAPTTSRPSRTPTDTPTTSQPSRTPTDTPTSSPPAPGESTSVTPSPEASPSTGESSPAADETSGDDGVPPWVWWLLAALVVAGSVVGVLLAVRAKRRRVWRESVESAEREVAWLAREHVPQLRDTGSLERVAGGWQVGLPRVTALEDQLTVLESSAANEADAARAHGLREAVRTAHARVDSLTAGAPQDTWALDLDEVIALLESALATTAQPGGAAPGPPAQA